MRSQQNTGYSIDGAYAEYAVADARYAVAGTGGVDPLDAAPLTCAGVTTYKAVKVSGARSGDSSRSSASAGSDTWPCSTPDRRRHRRGGRRHEDKLDLAKELGADVLSTLEGGPRRRHSGAGRCRRRDRPGRQPAAIEQAFASLRRGGRLVLVALPKDGELELPIFETVLKGISVIGSIVGTRRDLAEVFELHAAGRTQVVLEERKLDQINESFDDVLSGRTPARLVIRM